MTKKLINRKVSKPTKKSIQQQHKKLVKQCLKLWSQCVIMRDKTCRNCNSDYKLTSHHIRSVTNKNTMFDIENGICLCWEECHCQQKWHPERFQDIVIEIIGNKYYERMKRKSQVKIEYSVEDLQEIKEHLTKTLEKLKDE